MNGSRTRRMATGAGWIYSYRWLERLLDFVSIVVLARILAPEDFGLVAIAASIVIIIEGLSAFDVNKALIRSRSNDRELYDTAWTLSVIRGLLSALVMVVLSVFVPDPRVAALILVLALSPLLTGLANPRFVMFERDLVFSRLAVLTLVSKVASVTVTLALAVLTRSYWSIAIGMLVGVLGSCAISYALKPYRPRFSLSRLAEIFGFSGWLTLTSIVTTLSMETDKIIVGRLLGVADAGRYFMTQRVGVLPTRELISPLQRLLFPSFSELADDRDRLRREAGESINWLASLSLPAGFGFALIANDFVPLVLGPQWSTIVPLLQILVPYLGLRATLSVALPSVMALGRTRLLFWVSLAYAVVHLPLFIAGTAFYGLTGAIVGIVAAGVLYIGLNAFLLQTSLDIRWPQILSQARRPLLAVAGMVAVIAGLAVVLPLELFSAAGSWPSLLVKLLSGAVVYCGLLFFLWRLADRPVGLEQRVLELLWGEDGDG
jgi:PST family polysaccharide transporter